MAEVNLNIRGKNYPIVCDDGQEQHIQNLAQYIDSQVGEIAASGAADNDNHMLVLTALIMADKIHEQQGQLEAAEQILSEAGKELPSSSVDEKAVAEAISSLASRISLVAGRLKNA